MKHKLASTISFVFHPLLMSTVMFAILVLYAPNTIFPFHVSNKAQWLMVLMVFLTTFLIPSLSLLILKLTQSISSLSLFDRKERVVPFFYTTIFYGITAYLFGRQLGLDSIIVWLLGGTTIIILFSAIITTRWKISAHAAGVGGFVGYLLALRIDYVEPEMNFLIAFGFVVSGFVLSSRLYLDAHTPRQVYAGFGLGLFISFVTLYLS